MAVHWCLLLGGSGCSAAVKLWDSSKFMVAARLFSCVGCCCLALLLQVIGRLVGNHKASISCLITLPSKAHFKTLEDQQAAAGVQAVKQRQHQDKAAGAAALAAVAAPPMFVPSVDLVFGGDSAGGLYVWEPFRTPLGSAEREIGPKMTFPGHTGEVWAACLTPGAEDPQTASAKIFTAGRWVQLSRHLTLAWRLFAVVLWTGRNCCQWRVRLVPSPSFIAAMEQSV